VQWFRRKDKQVRTMHRHSCRITTLLCLLKCSRAKYGQSSSGSSDLEPNLERELRFGEKPGAGAPFWSQTSSGSFVLEQNLEREL